jgi:hypothetical protein
MISPHSGKQGAASMSKSGVTPKQGRERPFYLPFCVDPIYEIQKTDRMQILDVLPADDAGKKEDIVKIYNYLMALILVSVCLPTVHAQEYGKIRALDQRAAHIIKQRNDFVTQVLASYAIPHECNEQGAVVRIKMDGQWLAVSTVEIVPVLRESTDKQKQVIAHELLFYTVRGILALPSELTIH